MSSPPSGRLHLRRNSLELLQYAKRFQEKYILHPLWNNTSMGKIGEVSQVPDVDIAEAGCCKYLLIEVQNRDINCGPPKLIVRGDASCAYHDDIMDKIESEIDEKKLILDCKGGGRIEVDPATRTISIYGQSQEFGPADHYITVEILKKQYPEWTIEVSDDEYKE